MYAPARVNVLVFVIIAISFFTLNEAYPSLVLRSIGNRLDSECTWGFIRLPDNEFVCARGPGQSCSTKSNSKMQCGDGMTCDPEDGVDVCRGCSTFDIISCYPIIF